MDQKRRDRIQLECLYEMFRDNIDEDVIYIIYTENKSNIEPTIEQLMPISASSFTGHYFDRPSDGVQQAKSSNENSIYKPLSNCSDQNSNKVPKATSNGAAKTRSNCSSLKAHKRAESKSPQTSQGDSWPDVEDEEEEEYEDEREELTLDEKIEKLRKSIDDLLAEKNTSHEKASKYLSRKMFSVTSYYSELASSMRRMIESRTNKLVDLLLEKSKDSDFIDLHGLNPIQARLVVSELIKIRQNKLLIDKQGQVSVDIITGWGKHSPDQGQRIKPTIVALLREQQLEFHRVNRGALRVTIRRFPFRG